MRPYWSGHTIPCRVFSWVSTSSPLERHWFADWNVKFLSGFGGIGVTGRYGALRGVASMALLSASGALASDRQRHTHQGACAATAAFILASSQNGGAISRIMGQFGCRRATQPSPRGGEPSGRTCVWDWRDGLKRRSEWYPRYLGAADQSALLDLWTSLAMAPFSSGGSALSAVDDT